MKLLHLRIRHFGAVLALLFLLPLLAVPSHADAGDLDQISRYVVTVDPREDGTADITYEIDWDVIGGDAGDALSWVKIGLPNAHNDSFENLTPKTVSSVTPLNENGSFAKIVFLQRYYAPDVAAGNGGQSSVQFAFRVHQSHLFVYNSDGSADFTFTPGWFEDLCISELVIRWRADEGISADNTGTEDGYLVWRAEDLGHGEKLTAQVKADASLALGFDSSSAATEDEIYYTTAEDDSNDPLIGAAICVMLAFLVIGLVRRSPVWRGGFGQEDDENWAWYSNGVNVIHMAPHLPPPSGYHPVEPPVHTGGGSTRGGGAGRSSHHAGCACACVSSCACACACAGGGRAGCSVKNFYRVSIRPSSEEENGGCHES